MLRGVRVMCRWRAHLLRATSRVGSRFASLERSIPYDALVGGGLSSPVCRRCGCGISYLLTYLSDDTSWGRRSLNCAKGTWHRL